MINFKDALAALNVDHVASGNDAESLQWTVRQVLKVKVVPGLTATEQSPKLQALSRNQQLNQINEMTATWNNQ